MKAIIIEDEILVSNALKQMLRLIDESIEVVAIASHVNDAVQKIIANQPDIVFLDVELEDGTGFDILKKLDSTNFKTIFTTAYNQYAIKAFKYSAVDYLLKPIDPTELQDALIRAKNAISNKKEYQELLSVLNENIEQQEKKIVLKTSGQQFVIKVADIIHLQADGAYTSFVSTKMKIIISKNIKFYQNLLDDNFVRCHQSHLVNIKHVLGIKSGQLRMTNGDLIPISTRKKSSILQMVNNL